MDLSKMIAAAKGFIGRFSLVALALLLVIGLSGTLTCLKAAYGEEEADAGTEAPAASEVPQPTAPDQEADEGDGLQEPTTPPEAPIIVEEAPRAPAADVLVTDELAEATAEVAAAQPQAEGAAPYDVYVYMRIEDEQGHPLGKDQLKALGLSVEVNGSGWMTMGYLPAVPIGYPVWIGEYGSSGQLDDALAHLPEMVPFFDAQGLPVNGQVDPFAEGTRWELSGANGANDYVPAGTLTWHLSGHVPVSLLRDYEVNRINSETLVEIEDPEVLASSIGDRISIDTVDPTAPEGYRYVAGGPEVLTVTPYSDLNRFALFYQPEEAVIQFDAEGGTPVEPLVGVTDESIADTAMPASAKEGYILSGWYADKDHEGAAVEQLPAAFPAGETTYYADWRPDAAADGALPPSMDDGNAGLEGELPSDDGLSVVVPVSDGEASTAVVSDYNAARLGQTGDENIAAITALLALLVGSVALAAASNLRKRPSGSGQQGN